MSDRRITYLKFSWLVCLKTSFFTAPTIGKIGVEGTTPPGVDGVVSYSTAIRLNFRFLRVFGLIGEKIWSTKWNSIFRYWPHLAGLKFSFNESDSKFPNTFACLDFDYSLCSWRSSESVNVGLTPPSMLLYASAGWNRIYNLVDWMALAIRLVKTT